MSAHLQKPEVLSLGDKKYTFRRLGVLEPSTFIGMFKHLWKTGTLDLEKFLEIVPNSAEHGKLNLDSLTILFGLEHVFSMIVQVMSDLLKEVDDQGKLVDIPIEDFVDPDKFQLPFLIDALFALSRHPDLALAKASLEKNKESDNPFFQALLQVLKPVK